MATNYIEMLIIQLLRRAVQRWVPHKKGQLNCKRIFTWTVSDCFPAPALTYDFDQCRGTQSIWSIPHLPHLCAFESHLCPQFGTAVILGIGYLPEPGPGPGPGQATGICCLLMFLLCPQSDYHLALIYDTQFASIGAGRAACGKGRR